MTDEIVVEYDEHNKNWSSNPESNTLFLRGTRNHFCRLLEIRGHVFLNEIFDELSIDRLRVGQTHGWIHQTGGDLPDLFSYIILYGRDTPFALRFETQGNILRCLPE